MAGAISASYSPGCPERIEFEWTSDASGDVNGITHRVEGAIVRVVFIPDPTDIPSANYDVELEVDGVDLLANQGANRSDTVSQHLAPGVPFTDGTTTSIAPPQVNDGVELKISNAGASKKGKVVIYTR